MATTMGNGSDVVSFLKQQHAHIKTMFEDVIESRGRERVKAFHALRRMLAVHETAEEEIVHPVAKRALPGGVTIVEARLKEEHDVKKALSELEKIDVNSLEFERKLEALKTSIVLHAEAEEQEEFERLPNELDPRRLDRMRMLVELAEKVAPTHPHAGIESAAANMFIGPFAALIDRARDAFASKA
jgi:hypothetical protein